MTVAEKISMTEDVRVAMSSPQELPTANMVAYPFPIREGQIARLVLPRDITMEEVQRLRAFMATLAIDYAEWRKRRNQEVH